MLQASDQHASRAPPKPPAFCLKHILQGGWGDRRHAGEVRCLGWMVVCLLLLYIGVKMAHTGFNVDLK